MKKSKLVTLGLVALSIAACDNEPKHKHPSKDDWNNNNQNPQAYVSTDGGNSYGLGNNFWFWMYILKGNNGYGYYPGASYTTHNYYYGGKSGFRSSNNRSIKSNGRVSSFGGRSARVSRGGFGSSGSHVSA
jgi:hypothetical protein